MKMSPVKLVKESNKSVVLQASV